MIAVTRLLGNPHWFGAEFHHEGFRNGPHTLRRRHSEDRTGEAVQIHARTRQGQRRVQGQGHGTDARRWVKDLEAITASRVDHELPGPNRSE